MICKHISSNKTPLKTHSGLIFAHLSPRAPIWRDKEIVASIWRIKVIITPPNTLISDLRQDFKDFDETIGEGCGLEWWKWVSS